MRAVAGMNCHMPAAPLGLTAEFENPLSIMGSQQRSSGRPLSANPRRIIGREGRPAPANDSWTRVPAPGSTAARNAPADGSSTGGRPGSIRWRPKRRDPGLPASQRSKSENARTPVNMRSPPRTHRTPREQRRRQAGPASPAGWLPREAAGWWERTAWADFITVQPFVPLLKSLRRRTMARYRDLGAHRKARSQFYVPVFISKQPFSSSAFPCWS